MSKKRQSRKSRRASQTADQAVSSTGGARGRRSQEFNPDYSQTIKDLRRIGILAGTFFVILVTLSFFLR